MARGVPDNSDEEARAVRRMLAIEPPSSVRGSGSSASLINIILTKIQQTKGWLLR